MITTAKPTKTVNVTRTSYAKLPDKVRAYIGTIKNYDELLVTGYIPIIKLDSRKPEVKRAMKWLGKKFVNLSFMPVFIPKIKKGYKITTIREGVKDIAEGDILQIFTGLRTKKCKKHMQLMCTGVQSITIFRNKVKIDGVEYSGIKLSFFVYADGFSICDDFFKFFRERYNTDKKMFRGTVIHWTHLK